MPGNESDICRLLSASHTYKDAGVDTGQAETALGRMVKHIKGTWAHPANFGKVQLDIGYFANVLDFGGIGVAISTDGVGSKALIAQMAGIYDTIGIDCVAMNVNDLICVGAQPISMVDYIAVQNADPVLLEKLSIGLCKGAKCAGISISGGETAQIKDIIKGHKDGIGFDLVGTAIGRVDLDKIVIGADIEEGDTVVGIESSGIHSNGLSLARHAFFELHQYKFGHKFEQLKHPLVVELLEPTFIYVKEIMDVLHKLRGVKALVHITSDGLLNLTRVAADVGYVIDALPPVPPIFSLVQRHSHVDDAEMFRVYNMGIGFCVVVKADEADQVLSILKSHGRTAHKIGYAVPDREKRVLLRKQRLIGRGGQFYPL
jgi:phosphoribosylformylglycinamidine cyclo-ligase